MSGIDRSSRSGRHELLLEVEMNRLIALALVALLTATTMLIGNSSTAAAADTSCNCVLWVRSQTGLPSGPNTAAGYTEKVMSSLGYKRVGPTAGAIMVWDANQKGA